MSFRIANEAAWIARQDQPAALAPPVQNQARQPVAPLPGNSNAALPAQAAAKQSDGGDPHADVNSDASPPQDRQADVEARERASEAQEPLTDEEDDHAAAAGGAEQNASALPGASS